MAVMRNSIIFGGVDSADFGIYIGGEGTFNAPKRDVEMINIPGRNGALALDKGRYENIEVAYSAFNYETDLATFAKQLSDFRNAICSQKGYQRLTDTFHLEEYRMATYVDGLEIKPINFNTAATFDIVFNCQPQRFLMSGEAPIAVASGDTILNPTHFESKPMLEVEGYGTIGFNGFEIELANAVLGTVNIASQGSTANTSIVKTFSKEQFNNGDAITISDQAGSQGIGLDYQLGFANLSGYSTSVDNSNSSFSTSFTTSGEGIVLHHYCKTTSTPIEFIAGTASTVSNITTWTRKDQNDVVKGHVYQETTISYIPNYSDTLSAISLQTSIWFSEEYIDTSTPQINLSWKDIKGESSVSILGHPTYIDCDLGEAYLIKNDTPISLNQHIDLGSELPTLASGSNEITFDNTITELKVIPRWWIV